MLSKHRRSCPRRCCRRRWCPTRCCRRRRCPRRCCRRAHRRCPRRCCRHRSCPRRCCPHRWCPRRCCRRRSCPTRCCRRRSQCARRLRPTQPSVDHALPSGLMYPPEIMWLPQMQMFAPATLHRHHAAGLVPVVKLREPNGAQHIQKSGALFERVVASVHLSGVLQNPFDEVWRELRVRLEHQRDGARHLRSRHAGAAEAHIRRITGVDAAVDEVVAVRGVERAPGTANDRMPNAGRNEIGLGEIVAAGRSARAEVSRACRRTRRSCLRCSTRRP